MRVSDALPTTATNKVLKRELIEDGVGGTGGGDTWWEREERGTSYSVLADSRAGAGL